MTVTVKDLAEAAGVSRGTVDRVLHNRGSVRDDVALRVKALAREMGYVPNRAGRALGMHRRYTVGVLLPSIGNVFFDDVLEGVSNATRDFSDMGVDVVVRKIQGYDEDVHLRAIDDLASRGCAALCLATISTPRIAAKINALTDSGVHVVLVNSDVEGARRLCYVGSDYLKAGRTSAGMLALVSRFDKLRILVVAGSMRMLGHEQRVEGLKSELDRLKVPYEIRKTCECSDSDILAQKLTSAALEADPLINCVCVTGGGAQGVGAALIACEGRDYIASAYDDIYTTKELVRAGVFKFVVCQQPERQGYHAIKRACQAVAGIITEPKVDDFITETLIRISTNLD
jgi:LacI family transcriptional regulator